jgi:biopolymer transport protein ExbB
VGIEHRADEPVLLREVIMDAASMEIPRMERFLSALGTVANISTLLGLLGTVTGNIRAFGVFGSFGGISDPGQLAKGISEALITTAAGLIVSIPTVIFYNYLVTKVNHIIIRLENRVNDMVHLLQGGRGK